MLLSCPVIPINKIGTWWHCHQDSGSHSFMSPGKPPAKRRGQQIYYPILLPGWDFFPFQVSRGLFFYHKGPKVQRGEARGTWVCYLLVPSFATKQCHAPFPGLRPSVLSSPDELLGWEKNRWSPLPTCIPSPALARTAAVGEELGKPGGSSTSASSILHSHLVIIRNFSWWKSLSKTTYTTPQTVYSSSPVHQFFSINGSFGPSLFSLAIHSSSLALPPNQLWFHVPSF